MQRLQRLERIFAVHHERAVNRDNTVEIAHRVLQIEKTPWRNTLSGCSVTVYEQRHPQRGLWAARSGTVQFEVAAEE